MRWLWRNKLHLLVFGVYAVFLLTANQLYAALFVKQGNAIPGETSLPSEKAEILANVDSVKNVMYDGEEVYELNGWVFAPGVPGSGQYQKKLVLHSVHGDIIFQANSEYRSDVSKVFSKYNMNLDNAGFLVRISKYALKIDNYKIGFILEDPESGKRIYGMLNKYIERTPNKLRFVNGD